MTITVTSLVAGPFTATGLSQTTAFAFKVFSDEEIEVYYGADETLVDPADYTVDRNISVAGDALEGGNVTLDAGAIASGESFYIRAVPEFIQEQTYTSAGTRLENLNEALDRGALRDIHMRDRIEVVEGINGSASDALAAAQTAVAAQEAAVTARAEAQVAAAAAAAATSGKVDLTGGNITDVLSFRAAINAGPVIDLFDFMTIAEQADAQTGNPAIDTTAKIQSAINYAAAVGVKITGYGVFLTSAKVVLKGDTDFSMAVFKVSGTPPIALEISTGEGDDPVTILKLSQDLVIRTPVLINMTKPVTGWAEQGEGLRVVNLQNGRVFVNTISQFAIGLHVTSFVQMSAYNTFHVGLLLNNKVNRQESVGPGGGATNTNLFIGGHYFHYTDEGDGIAGCYTINIEPHPTRSVINHSVTIGACLEGTTPQYNVRDGGQFNSFNDCRWETPWAFGGPKFHQAQSDPVQAGQGGPSIVRGGYGNDEFDYFTVTNDPGADCKMVNDNTGLGRHLRSGPVDLLNTAGGGAPVFRGFAASDLAVFNSTLNRDTDWSWQISDVGLEGKLGSLPYPQIILKFDGTIWLGNGGSAPTAAFGNVGSGSGLEIAKPAYLKVQTLNPGNLGGYMTLAAMDDNTLKCVLPDGTVKTIAFV